MSDKHSQTLTDNTLHGLFWLFSGNMSQAILRLIVTIIMARLLTPSEFGVIGAAMIVISFSEIVSLLGVGSAVIQIKELTLKHIHVGYTLSTILALSVGVIVVLSASSISQFFRMPDLKPVIQTLSVLFLIMGFSAVSKAQLQRTFRFKALAVIQIISFLFGYGMTGIYLAYTGWGVWALVFANIASALINVTLLLIINRKSIGFSLSKNEMYHLMNFGIGFSLAKIANSFALQVDNIVVGRLLGAEALGIYGRAYGFLMIPTSLFGGVVDKVLFPAMSSIQHDKQRLRLAYLKSVALIFMLTLPISGLMVILSPEIVSILLGKQWLGVVLPFQILSLVLVFRTASKMSDSLTRATGAVYRRAWRQWIYFAAVFTGALAGGHFWGLGGVAFGVGLAILLNFLLMFQLCAKLIGVEWKDLFIPFLRYIIITLFINGLVLISITVLKSYNFNPIFVLLLGLITFGALVLTVWHLFHSLFGSEGVWLKSIIQQKMPWLGRLI